MVLCVVLGVSVVIVVRGGMVDRIAIVVRVVTVVDGVWLRVRGCCSGCHVRCVVCVV